MKQALKRLQQTGIAPSRATPIDYDSAASPGATTGRGILLLTDEALYLGGHNQIGAQRIPLEEIGSTSVNLFGRAGSYLVYDRSGALIANLAVSTARPSFVSVFQVLGSK